MHHRSVGWVQHQCASLHIVWGSGRLCFLVPLSYRTYYVCFFFRGIPLLSLSLPHFKVYMGTITGGWQSDRKLAKHLGRAEVSRIILYVVASFFRY